MSDINRSYFTGRLGRDPELRYTQNQTAVCSFSIAVERMKPKNADKGETDWIDCVAWSHTAEYISKYFQKGNLVMIEAQARTRVYDDKNGAKHKVVEFLVSDIKSSGNSNGNSNGQRSGGYQQQQNDANGSDNDGFMDVATDEDNLPFN